MLATWIEMNSQTFIQHFAKLNDIAQNATHENFIAIQKFQNDILNDYTLGALSELEKRTLYNASSIIMDKMRKELLGPNRRSK